MSLIVPGISPKLVGAPAPFRGALLSKNVAQTVLANVLTILAWQVSEEDRGGWFANPGDNFVSVPPGVSRVRLSAGVSWSSAGGSFKDITFLKNSLPSPGLPADRGTGGASLVSIVSAVVAVVPGDEFSVEVRHNVAPDADVLVSEMTYFSVEAIR